MAYTFSIIVPHKNTLQLLQRCLDSIPRIDGLQIIVVDDNSDLTSEERAAFPGLDREDTEVYFTHEGQGAGYARNVGLRHAKGDWLIFADADDYFFSDNLLRLTTLDFPEDAEIVVWRSKYVYTDNSYRWIGPSETDCKIAHCNDLSRLYLDYVMPWTKMVHRSVVERNNIRFEEVRYGNDEMFSTLLSIHATDYYEIGIDVYCHERQKGSLVETATKESCLCRIGVIMRKNRLLKKNGRKLFIPTNWYETLIRINYCSFLRCMMHELCTFGFSQTMHDYKLVCNHTNISKIPFLTKITKRK